MSRLKIKKHFSMAFLGEAWKDGYINFSSFTAQDVSDNIATDVDVNNPNPELVKKNYDAMIQKLEEHFIDGKIPTEDGKLEDIKKGELGSLDVDIIQGAITFLSQSQTQPLPTQSVKS